jgi:hypothetical protein
MPIKEAIYNLDDNSYIFECPHCNDLIQVMEDEIYCCIFRCGLYKNTFEQIDPHTSKDECDRLFNEGLIYGCGKPFKFIQENSPYVEECEYI